MCPGWNTSWHGARGGLGRLACSVASILVSIFSLMSHGAPYCIGLGEFHSAHSSLGQANVAATTARRISSDFIFVAAVLAVYSLNSCMRENAWKYIIV